MLGGTPSSSPPEVIKEIPTTVGAVLADAHVAGLETKAEVDGALGDLANIFAEMVALYAAIREVPTGSSLTIVHDYLGVDRFMRGEWESKDEPIRRVVGRVEVRCGLAIASHTATVCYERGAPGVPRRNPPIVPRA